MNIFICCSKAFYDQIPPIKTFLENQGHNITLPISYDDPDKENSFILGSPEYLAWKAATIREHETKIRPEDALNWNEGGPIVPLE
jgi:hypothetical protein